MPVNQSASNSFKPTLLPRPEKQSSPQQAALTYLPPDLLPALAESAGTDPDALATLTVTSRSDLYVAITEYVTLATDRIPIFCDGNEKGECSSDDDCSRLGLRRPTNKNKKRPSIPAIHLALGFAHFQWPPPPHLTASFLAEKKGRRPVSKSEEDTTSENPNIAVPLSLHLANYTVGAPSNHCGAYREFIVATTNSNDELRRFAKEVCEWHYDKEGVKPETEDRFSLFRFQSNYNEWRSKGKNRVREAKSVVLAGDMLQEILNDVESFLRPETTEWYIQHGVPVRRTYLFYGPPGTGKTSTIRVIASKFKLRCCFLTLTSGGITNETLADALAALPKKALVVIEDVDALFNSDRRNAFGGELSFSGLLNALDGLVSVDGVVTVLTTNHIEKLDKALIRGGRVDRRFLFDRPSDDQLREFFRFFYPNATKEVVNEFLKAVNERSEEEAKLISTLQQLFIKMRGKADSECVAGVRDFFDKQLPKEEDLNFIYM